MAAPRRSRLTSKPTDASVADERSARLEAVIRERISTRLGRRVRNLVVEVDRGVIRLAGQCSTYYSKQLAQHAVLGVVEDERIDNRIEIAAPRSR